MKPIATIAFYSLRAEIRHIVDNAERRLTASEIYRLLKRRASRQVFGVTICQMVDARQLRKGRAPKRCVHQGVRFVYGPGVMPVSNGRYRADRPERIKGFMALKRDREAKAGRRARSTV